MKKEEKKCYHCGKALTVEDFYFTEDDCNIICEDCFNDYYFICEECGCVCSHDDGYYVKDFGYICADCHDTSTFQHCEHCGQLFRIEDTIFCESNCGYFCEKCSDYYLYYCEKCGRYFLEEDYDFDQNCCDNCAIHNNIGTYHSHSYTKKYINYENEGVFFGFELEVEGYEENSAEELLVSNLLLDNIDDICLERDGSLVNGFEIISQPMSPAYFYNNFNYEKMMAILKEHGYTSHDNGDCGLHLHFDNSILTDDDISKIVFIYTHKYDFFIKLSRRSIQQAFEWAKKYCADDFDEQNKFKKNKGYGRYFAVNLNNFDTIEFRLGRGSLNVNTFLAWIDLHITLIKNVKKISWDNIENLEFWLDGISENTKNYIKNRLEV